MRSCLMAVVIGVVLCGVPAAAADLEWDVDSSTSGAQPGTGIWNKVLTNWWNGSTNVSWVDGDKATFGKSDPISPQPYTVTLTEDVWAKRVHINSDANGVTFDGDYELGLGGSVLNEDGLFIARDQSNVVVNCDISNTGSQNTIDPEIRVQRGSGDPLIVNGNIYIRDVHTGTDDLIFRRHSNGLAQTNLASIVLNGTLDSTGSTVDIIGYDDQKKLNRLEVVVNGAMLIYGMSADRKDPLELRLRTGGELVLKQAYFG